MRERTKLGAMLRDARKSRGFKLLYVSTTLGLRGPSFLSRIEAGKDLPSKRLAGQLAEVLELPKATLYQAMLEANAERLRRVLAID